MHDLRTRFGSWLLPGLLPRVLPGLVLGICLCFLGAVGISGIAVAETDAAAELADIQARIKAIQAELSSDQERRDAVSIELEKFERQVAEAAKKLAALNEELDIKSTSLQSARREREQSLTRLQREKQALIKQIQGAYIMGAQQNLKLLMTQEDPSKLGRILVYYDYVNKARTQRMQSVKGELERLVALTTQIEAETVELADLQQQQQSTFQRLENNRAERQRIVEQLTAAITQRGDELQRAASAEKQLTKLLESLARDLQDIAPDIGRQRSFAQQKGRLRWPVTGRRLNRFNAWREPGKLRWRGIMIAADPGSPVRAVAYGRVVYADWMPRFGMLLIVEHDGGYMSLYAHNETIFKQVGDAVEPGQVIATVGNSGGQAQSGLYFEIRKRGNTVNPAIWCKRPAAS